MPAINKVNLLSFNKFKALAKNLKPFLLFVPEVDPNKIILLSLFILKYFFELSLSIDFQKFKSIPYGTF